MYSERYVPQTIVLAFREHKIVCNIGFFGNKHETKKTCSTFLTQNGKDFEKRQYRTLYIHGSWTVISKQL